MVELNDPSIRNMGLSVSETRNLWWPENAMEPIGKTSMTPHSNVNEMAALKWGAATDIGRLRERHEDAFAIEPEIGLFMVVDGMGGHSSGGLAAQMVAQDLPPMIENRLDTLKRHSPQAVRGLLKTALVEQNRYLHAEGNSESGCAGMGATLALLLLDGGRAYIANVGDSRVYQFRRGQLTQLSVDHSVVAELLRTGKITPEEALHHSSQGIVTQYLGMPEPIQPLIRSVALHGDDRFLLCSDGLTDLVGERAIAGALRAETRPQIACDRLVEAATDNITVVIVSWPQAD